RGRGYEWAHSTMDVHQACDAADAIFREVSGSTWLPGYNYDFWSLPYLTGKGFTVDQIGRFLRTVQRLLPYNGAPAHADREAGRALGLAELERLFAEVRVAPPKYQAMA